MVFRSIRDVGGVSVAVAGLITRQVMGLARLCAGRVSGLVAVDIADLGRRYRTWNSNHSPFGQRSCQRAGIDLTAAGV